MIDVIKEMLVFTPEFIRALIVFVVMIFIDYATGVLCALSTQSLKSKVMREGLWRKIGFVLAVVAFYAIGTLAGVQNYFGIGSATLFAINEVLSITENLGKLGVPIPKFITKFIVDLKDKYDTEEYTGNHEA